MTTMETNTTPLWSLCLILLAATGLAALGLAATDDADPSTSSTSSNGCGPNGTVGCYDSIQAAIDASNETFPVVVAAASENGPENPTPFRESIRLHRPGVTVCSASAEAAESPDDEPSQDPGPIVLAPSDDFCDPQPASAVVEAPASLPEASR